MPTIRKFKVGDVIRPTEGKKSSNEYQLKNILGAEVVSFPNQSSWERRRIKIKLLQVEKDGVYHPWRDRAYKDQVIEVYEDAFELTVRPDEDYDIY